MVKSWRKPLQSWSGKASVVDYPAYSLVWCEGFIETCNPSTNENRKLAAQKLQSRCVCVHYTVPATTRM